MAPGVSRATAREVVLNIHSALALLVAATASPASPPPAAQPVPDRAREAVVKALAAASDVPGQARNLVALAWPNGPRDEVVSARARRELGNFGDHSMVALREALNAVKTGYTEEVVTTTLQAQSNCRVELAPQFVANIIDALWVGSHGAKVLAIQDLSLDPNALAVHPMIDSAIDDPSLVPIVVGALGAMRFPQARFYLEKVMMEGPPEVRPAAATALAQIGGAALGPLKNALKAPSKDARLLAARVLLPVATEYDLGAIYEYLDKHGDDDASLTESLKAIAASIEKAIAAREASAAADSLKN